MTVGGRTLTNSIYKEEEKSKQKKKTHYRVKQTKKESVIREHQYCKNEKEKVRFTVFLFIFKEKTNTGLDYYSKMEVGFFFVLFMDG